MFKAQSDFPKVAIKTIDGKRVVIPFLKKGQAAYEMVYLRTPFNPHGFSDSTMTFKIYDSIKKITYKVLISDLDEDGKEVGAAAVVVFDIDKNPLSLRLRDISTMDSVEDLNFIRAHPEAYSVSIKKY